MITCPRCGLAVYPDTPACPRCNTPLTPAAPYGQAAGAPGYGGYQQGDTMGDNMPTWMRAVQGQALNQQRQGAQSGALGSAGIPPAAPRNGVSLSEMISEENLPEWLRGAADAPGGAPGAYPGYPQGQAQQWNAPRSPGYPPSGYPGYSADPRATGNMATASSTPYPPASAPSVSAGQFVDESALPDWLRQVGGADAARQPAPPNQAPNGGYAPAQGYGQPGYGQGYPPSGQLAPQPPQPAQPSAAFPSLDQASYGAAQGRPMGAPHGGDQGGMAAQSLLDPGALPSWLGGPNGAAPQVGGRGAGGEANGRGANMGMQAGSLIDENALPQWLRNEPATATPSQRVPAVAPGAVSQWITGSTDEPLPGWLNQVYADTPAAPQPARAPQTPYMPAQPYAPSAGYAPQATPYTPEAGVAAAGAVAAGQFIDESALPDWLKAQGAAPQTAYPAAPQSGYLAPQQPMQGHTSGYPQPQPPAQSPGQPAPLSMPVGAPPEGANGLFAPQPSQQFPEAEPGPLFSASDLIDPDALPSWVSGGQGKGSTSKQRAVSPQSNGAGRISGAAGWDDEDANGAAGMSDQSGASVTRRAATTLGQATSRQPRPPTPPNGQPGRRGQGGAPSGALGPMGDGWDDAPAPYTQRQPAPAARLGRMQLDDDGWNGNAPAAQAGRPPARPAPPVQRAPGTGGLGQGAPLQQNELPAWLRAGSPHGQANGGAQGQRGYGASPAQREPTYDEWGLPVEWGEDGANDGAAGYDGYADGNPGYADPGYDGAFDDGYADRLPYGANGRGQSRAAGGGRGAPRPPQQQEKRGWRRIFGRR